MSYLQLAGTAWDVWRAQRDSLDGILARQQRRCRELVAFARDRSRFYNRQYSSLPHDGWELRDLPPVNKVQLMTSFDAWVTDPRVTHASAESFITNEAESGRSYLGHYLVRWTSGTTGERGIFVHDAADMLTVRAISIVRAWLAGITLPRLWRMAKHQGRLAVVLATGGGTVAHDVEAIARSLPAGLGSRIRVLSVYRPLPDIVRELNAFQPAELHTYPSVLSMLAEEQLTGRLRIRPARIICGGEWLSTATRAAAQAAFHCSVLETYAASEVLRLAISCGYGRLHLNADWVILEPVDADYQPVPAGRKPQTTLVTNLANRVAPLIRYDLGDCVTVDPDACRCGSPLPSIVVDGRRDETLSFTGDRPDSVRLSPRALASLFDWVPGVGRCQIIQDSPASLRIRFDTRGSVNDQQVWETIRRDLRRYLVSQGLEKVTVERASEPPGRDPRTGKYRKVWSEL